MRDIFQAVQDAAVKMRPVKAKDNFTGDVEEISAKASSIMCSCRGKCGSHIGPCGNQVIGGLACKACTMAMSKK